MNFLERLISTLTVDTVDVYDIQAFYVMEIQQRPRSSGRVAVFARLADSTPSSGRSRYNDRNYDTWKRVSYVRKVNFDQDEANKVERILLDKRREAHAD